MHIAGGRGATMSFYIGIDFGSNAAKGVIIDQIGTVITWCSVKSMGKPIEAMRHILNHLKKEIPQWINIRGVGTTGSAGRLAGFMLNADVVKNEIIAHAVAASHSYPDVRTIIEIGGHNAILIIMRENMPVDFAMNTVCAAATGSFLDHQAIRFGIPIEEFGRCALHANRACRIASRCTVFAESDMVHKTQLGIPRNDIIAGLCHAIARNYLRTVAKGKSIEPPILFQGGVAANQGVKLAFEQALDMPVCVPEHYLVMGAIGAALLARHHGNKSHTFDLGKAIEASFVSRGFECADCPNNCEIVEALRAGKVIARQGSRCGKWNQDFGITIDVHSPHGSGLSFPA